MGDLYCLLGRPEFAMFQKKKPDFLCSTLTHINLRRLICATKMKIRNGYIDYNLYNLIFLAFLTWAPQRGLPFEFKIQKS